VYRESGVPGFATCICADISPDGVVSIANAGHLTPYRGGKEIQLPTALPLGISSLGEIAYEETRFTLERGETLTFMSDGVVEARSSTGELFGFDRTREISTLSASEIAQRAQLFGPEDDITVLTLSFAPVGIVHA
jgi:phosphoserine phosphatase RsbU/P